MLIMLGSEHQAFPACSMITEVTIITELLNVETFCAYPDLENLSSSYLAGHSATLSINAPPMCNTSCIGVDDDGEDEQN